MTGIAFGSERFELHLQAELIEPPPRSPLTDEAAAIRAALAQPIGSEPLERIVRPGERVALIVNDVTRRSRSELFLPILLDTLNRAGVPDSGIFIVFALGTHRPQTEDERRRIVGPEVSGRIRMFDHDGGDDANLVAAGRTSFGNTVEINRRVWEADRVVLTGQIMHHRISGFSGGRKNVVPGVAGNRTTTFNHRMIFDPRCRAGALDGNPTHEDMLEACRLLEPDFLLNVILDPGSRLLAVVAGHYDQAHRAGCQAADELLSTEVSAPYDVIVASAGGTPLDLNLRQAHKGMENARRALAPRGSLFYYGACSDGTGSAKIEEYVSRYAGAEEMKQALLENFVVGGHKAYWLAQLGREFDVHLVSRLDARFVERCGFRHVPPAEHQARLDDLLRAKGPAARVALMPYAGVTVVRGSRL